MLILSRRVAESVMIGTDIVITILGVKGNQVRVAIDAPKEVPVHREEVFERIKNGAPAHGSAVRFNSTASAPVDRSVHDSTRQKIAV